MPENVNANQISNDEPIGKVQKRFRVVDYAGVLSIAGHQRLTTRRNTDAVAKPLLQVERSGTALHLDFNGFSIHQPRDNC